MGNTIEEDDEDDGTFVTMKTMDDTFAPTSASSKYKCIDDFNPKHHADDVKEAFHDLIEDVKEGFQSFRSDGVFGGVSDLYEYLTDEPMNKKDPTKNASIVDIDRKLKLLNILLKVKSLMSIPKLKFQSSMNFFCHCLAL